MPYIFNVDGKFINRMQAMNLSKKTSCTMQKKDALYEM